MMKTLSSLSLLLCATLVAADIDWVRPQYVVSSRDNPPPGSQAAIKGIISRAQSSAKNGPWSVVNTGITPPSGNKHDFLAWAPYWWPNCQWCPPNNRKRVKGRSKSRPRSLVSPVCHLPAAISADIMQPFSTIRDEFDPIPYLLSSALRDPIPASFVPPTPTIMHAASPSPTLASVPQMGGAVPTTLSPIDTLPLQSQSSSRGLTPTEAAQAQAEKCTPSPTTSMAPSATWTTCPYIVRDGHTNPDNTMPPNKNQLQQMCQSVLDNALAFALTGSSQYAEKAAYFLDTFFKDTRYRMNPNADYAQLIRGPHPSGSFMGVLDLRSLVQVANAVNLLRYTKSPAWDGARDSAIVSWAKDYIHWLETNTYARIARTKDNNHVTFFYAQLSALQVLVKDEAGARQSLGLYFNGKFQEQIVQNGEQVFEANRTRPFHYRCFNLEAMITCAKLADSLGIDYWTKKTKYGARIQTALDYMITMDPGKDDPTCVFPHVTAVAAVYGDPTGKYKRYMQQKQQTSQNWAKESYYFFNQPQSFAMSPAKTRKRAFLERIEGEVPAHVHADRPAPFQFVDQIELDKAIFLTWNTARTIYETAAGGLEHSALIQS